MVPRPDVSTERKLQILQAAMQVFLLKGFSAARMDDIAAQAGLSVGNLYRYFPGKLDLTVGLMEMLLAPSLRKLGALVHAPGTCRERLEGAFLADLTAQGPQDMFLYAEMYHLARYEPAVRQVLQSYNTQYQKQIAFIIAQGIERGELRAVDPASVAFLFQALFDGVIQNVPLMDNDFDIQAVLRQIFAVVFEGLA